MRLLQSSPGSARLQTLLPHLSVVRGEADSGAGDSAKATGGNSESSSAGAGGLDELRPRGIGVAPTGKAKGVLRAEWPGRVYGVRAPEIGETPLSDAEWPFLFRGDLS